MPTASFCVFISYTMPLKAVDDKIRAQVERERVRARIIQLYREGELSLAAIGKHPDVMRGKSTVQMIIKNFGDRISTKAKKQPGRPSKLTKRCFYAFSNIYLVTFSIVTGSFVT